MRNEKPRHGKSLWCYCGKIAPIAISAAIVFTTVNLPNPDQQTGNLTLSEIAQIPTDAASIDMHATEVFNQPGFSLANLLQTPVIHAPTGTLAPSELAAPTPQRIDETATTPIAEEAAPLAEKPAEDTPAKPVEKLLPDVPIDAATQQRFFNESCEGNKQLFALMMAIAKRESDFRSTLIGDGGISYGIVQINTKWHMDRLHRLGLTKDELFDPVKCMLVGADYIKELAAKQNSSEVTHSLLMAYNQGPSSAQKSIRDGVTSSDYSREVMVNYQTYLSILK